MKEEILTSVSLRQKLRGEWQQEWTPAWLANFGKAENWLESICDAHNAALTAERERWKSDTDLKHVFQQLLSALAAIEKHNNAPIPHCPWGNIDVDLSLLHEHDAELTAPIFAAIGRAKVLCVMGKSQEALHVLERADMNGSLMEHDAEVRKPLVDLLTELRDHVSPRWRSKIDALAKVKP